MADNRRDFGFIHHPVRYRHRLLGFAGVITLHQHYFLAFDAASGVDIFRRLGCALPVLRAVRCVRAGKRASHANFDIRLSIKCRGKAAHQGNLER
ncbi:Uncharacterised protein [Atlantibacter hermannii]|nr:Uncharacterised protein [Atlantibacter hermannii]